MVKPCIVYVFYVSFGCTIECAIAHGVGLTGLDLGCLRDCSAMRRFQKLLDVRRTAPGGTALTAVFCVLFDLII